MVSLSECYEWFLNTNEWQVYDPTIESSFVVRRQYEDISLELEIVDTAGQDDYKVSIWIYLRNYEINIHEI